MIDIDNLDIKKEIEEKNLDTIEEKIQFAMYYLQRLQFQKAFAEITDIEENRDMHPGKTPLFFYLSRNNGASQKEISEHLNIKPPSLTVMVKRLEKDGLVKKVIDTNDGRKVKIFLNEKGEEIGFRHREVQKKITDVLFENFVDEEKIFFFDSLLKIIANLQKFQND